MNTTTTGPRLEHPIGREGLFSLGLRDGTARLRAIDGETIRIRDVHDHDLAETFAIELGDGSVSLRAMRGKGFDGRRDRGATPELEIELPHRATIVLEAASGDFVADGLGGDQRYRTASGDVTLHAGAGRIAIDAVSGDVQLVATDEATVTVRTVSGDVDVRAATLTSLEATTTSGDLRIAGRFAGPGPFGIVTVSGDVLLAPIGDLTVEMATLSGDLHSEVGGQLHSGRGRRSLAIGTGGPLVNVRSLSGDLTVARPKGVPGPTERVPARTTAATTPAPPPGPAAPQVLADPAPAGDDPRPTVTNGALAAAYDEARLRILRSLERGEIDVAEAGRRLETLESGDPDPSADTTRVSTAPSSDA